MIKTLIYFPPEYKNLALKIRENYIEHHHGEVDLVSETPDHLSDTHQLSHATPARSSA